MIEYVEMLKGFLTTEEVAQRLNVSTTRVRQMVISGVIKGVQKFGRINAIPEKEVDRLQSADRGPGRPRDEKPSDAAIKKRKSRANQSDPK